MPIALRLALRLDSRPLVACDVLTRLPCGQCPADVRPVGGGPPGIYFFTLDCSRVLPALGASMLFHLPYRLARISKRQTNRCTSTFVSERRCSGAGLEVEWETSGVPEVEGKVAQEAAFFVDVLEPSLRKQRAFFL